MVSKLNSEQEITGAALLQKAYGYWGEHPRHKQKEWSYEVSEDYTRLGYWDWVMEKLIEEEEDNGRA